jgi:hypothetical protein
MRNVIFMAVKRKVIFVENIPRYEIFGFYGRYRVPHIVRCIYIYSYNIHIIQHLRVVTQSLNIFWGE